MPELRERMALLLAERLKDGFADLEELPGGRVCGHVVSSEFRDLDYEQRRHRIRTVLELAINDGVLSADDLLRVSTLLTYTPEEWRVVLTDISE